MRDLAKQQGARRMSARLSLAAAGVTGLVLLWAILANSDQSQGWLRWILSIGLPPIVLSLVAALQYQRGQSWSAGAAAAAVYWVLLVVLNVEGAGLYVLGALLQTAAWFLSRPRRSDQTVDQYVVAAEPD
jgi:hypothetical protein